MSTVLKKTDCGKLNFSTINVPVVEREEKRHFRWATVVGGILLTSVLVWVGTFNLFHTENLEQFPAVPSTHVTREQWMARSTDYELTPLITPVSRVIIAHTASEGCTIRTQCILRTRAIQTFHIETKKFSDIAYNFLIGGDGDIYDGRGWDTQGAHTKDFNTDSVGIALIGNFMHSVPPIQQLNATLSLLHEGLLYGKLTKDFRLLGANQLVATSSPGTALAAVLKSWPHYSNDAQTLINSNDRN